MSKFILRANYEADTISYSSANGIVDVTIPMLQDEMLNYGINSIKNKLYSKSIYPTERGYDLFSLATMVYLADTRIERAVHGQDSWSREISIILPVKEKELWEKQILNIERMLQFLTGDIWNISFENREWNFSISEEVGERTDAYDRATLFSGGMDSLISTINLLEQNENVLLCSHAGDGYTKHAQTEIVDFFNQRYPDTLHELLDLWMNFPEDFIPKGGNDSNTRSRSFLFIGFASFVITGTKNIQQLLVPENGLIALNVPLDVTRVGSYSTRTTHPFYLKCWADLLNELGLGISIVNPYWNKTKGEMADECSNKEALKETMKLSVSCSSPGKARWLGIGAQHCGYCVPCIIRRAAMYKAFGMDVTDYTENSIKQMRRNSNTGIGIQLRSFEYAIDKIKSKPGLEKIYIHKSGPLPHDENILNGLAGVYKRGLLEVDGFITTILEEESDDI